MNSSVRKNALFYFLMHISAVLAAVLMAYVLFSSYISVSFFSGEKQYSFRPFSFSDSEVAEATGDIFSKQAADLMRYTASGIMLDSFDGIDIGRKIDVSDYYHGDTKVSFEISMNDLINLGRRDFMFSEHEMSLDEFGSTFDSAGSPRITLVQSLIRRYPDFISYNDYDGIDTVSIKEPDLGNDSSYISEAVKDASHSWDEYFVIISELKNASVLFAESYDNFRKGSETFADGNTNLIYTIRTVDRNGDVRVYSNAGQFSSGEDESLDSYYSSFKTYLICYYDELKFLSSAGTGETVISDVIRKYTDIYPDNTHIWMCVDDSYSLGNDIYRYINNEYDDIRNIDRLFTVFICILTVIWLFSLVVVSVRSGKLLPHDRIFLEFIIVFGIASFYLLRYYYGFLKDRVLSHDLTSSSRYVYFAGFGLLFSIVVSLAVLTTIRRIKNGALFEYSILKKFKDLFEYFALTLSGRSKATATVLVPYLIFLVVNLVGQSLAVNFIKTDKWLALLILVCIIIIDIFTGITLFLNTAEKKKLFEGVERIRAGETDYKIDASGLRAENRDLADSINNIGEGIDTAVKESMMEEKLRTELITNVSHDLKTPLTSIINYSDILNNRELSDKERKEYLEIIYDKSKRLKKLLEDLLEASKLSSGKLEMNREKTDITELINQALGEYGDRFGERELTVKIGELPKAYIYADPGAVWRIFNNLFDNICKYAMASTEIEVSMTSAGGRSIVKIRNISKVKPRFQGNELTERFIRGDESRNTEGTGLGLFIAKSLTEANEGRFEIIVDGNAFTTVVDLPEFKE